MKHSVRRRLLTLGILGIWLSVLGWHVRREYFKPADLLLLEGARSLAPGTFFYTVRQNDQAIGLATTRLDTAEGGGFRFNDRLILDVPAMGETHRATAITDIRLGPMLNLLSFRFELGSEIGAFTVNGYVNDSSLALHTRSNGGAAQRSRVPFRPGMLLDAAIPLRVAAAGLLKVGRTMQTHVFNPSTMTDQLIELQVSGRDTLVVPSGVRRAQDAQRWEPGTLDTIPVWRLEQKYGSVQVTSWVDEDGHMVKAQSPVGYTIERTAYELADQDWKAQLAVRKSADNYGAIIERTALAASVDLSTVAQADSLRIKLSGVDAAGFDLSGGRQQLRKDTLVVTRENARTLASNYVLPYRGADGPAKELLSTPFIQSDNAEIIEAARRIAAGSNDPAVVARRLNDWLYRELDKNLTLSLPSAVQVLQARQGDCNEHTVLYVALARALGLPARTAAGLVHVRGRFYFHAWPEVYLGSEWVAVDPTLGQFPADASHLRFVVGGLARQVELIRLIGRLRLDVV